MTTYATKLADFSRTPITLVVLTMDYCGRTFGVPPCTATGVQCYNTFPTCKDKANYLRQTKQYKFTSNAAPDVPFREGERPYLDRVVYSPTEIKDNQTVSARVTIELHDEPDNDIGIDPYYLARAATPPISSFWKKWLARNKNYKGRPVNVCEGFAGIAEGEFSCKFPGTIENIKIGRDGGVSIECIDLIKSMDNIDVPAKPDVKLLNAIDASQNEIIVYTPNQVTVTGLDSAGYVRIGSEIIKYTGFDSGQNKLTGCTRGFYSTTAATASANTHVQKCRYYSASNPFDIMKAMLLTDAGYSLGYVDSTAFDYWRDFPETDINYEAMISEPTKLKKLYFELVELTDCKSWQDENNKITIRRNMPNEPGRAYTYLSDDANIVQGSMSTDMNEKSRYTRVLIYWHPDPLGKTDEEETYSRRDISVDADAESVNEYGDSVEKKIFCRWISTRYLQEEVAARYVRNLGARILFRYRDAFPIVDFQVEIKDMDMKTGGYAIIATDEVLRRDGNPVNDVFQLVKRHHAASKSVTYRALKMPWKRVAFIAPDATPDFDTASDAQKEYGFICSDKGFIGETEASYHIW